MKYTKTYIKKLLLDNKQKLYTELKESKELLFLIKKSVTTNLSPDERKQLKSQLLDIFKSIPALTIFLLPGGMLLLPIAIKFITELMPSAFRDVKTVDEEE